MTTTVQSHPKREKFPSGEGKEMTVTKRGYCCHLTAGKLADCRAVRSVATEVYTLKTFQIKICDQPVASYIRNYL